MIQEKNAVLTRTISLTWKLFYVLRGWMMDGWMAMVCLFLTKLEKLTLPSCPSTCILSLPSLGSTFELPRLHRLNHSSNSSNTDLLRELSLFCVCMYVCIYLFTSGAQ